LPARVARLAQVARVQRKGLWRANTKILLHNPG
jgi:hypothetical protein